MRLELDWPIGDRGRHGYEAQPCIAYDSAPCQCADITELGDPKEESAEVEALESGG